MVICVRFVLQRDKSDECSRYEVYDGSARLLYRISGKNSPSGASMIIRDTGGSVLCRIRRLGFNSLSAYSISSGTETARLNIVVSGGRAAVRFRGISFHIRGDVLSGSYDILDVDNTAVCAVNKDFTKGRVGLSVDMKEREIFCIAAAACIDSLTLDPVPALQMT